LLAFDMVASIFFPEENLLSVYSLLEDSNAPMGSTNHMEQLNAGAPVSSST
jgi:hypothetical protein